MKNDGQSMKQLCKNGGELIWNDRRMMEHDRTMNDKSFLKDEQRVERSSLPLLMVACIKKMPVENIKQKSE